MLTKNNISIIGLKEYLLKYKDKFFDNDMSKYYLKNFIVIEIDNKNIQINVEYKSIINKQQQIIINDLPVSMDYLILRVLYIDKHHYINFIRNQKIKNMFYELSK